MTNKYNSHKQTQQQQQHQLKTGSPTVTPVVDKIV